MRQLFRDSGHLIRPAVVLLAALGLFLAIRTVLIPKAFGKYGHYSPAALDAVRQRPISYAGQEACVLCHEDKGQERALGRHAHASADDPAGRKPALPDVANLCRRCHEKDAAKPGGFPQVATAEHSGGMACNACHKPHNPHL